MDKDAFVAVGANFVRQVIALDLRNMLTKYAIQKVVTALEKLCLPAA